MQPDIRTIRQKNFLKSMMTNGAKAFTALKALLAFLPMNLSYLYREFLPFDCLSQSSCTWPRASMESAHRMRLYEWNDAPYLEDNPFLTLSRINPISTWFDSTASVIQFGFPIILAAIVSKLVLSRTVAETVPEWTPLQLISVLVRLTGLFYFIGYKTIGAVEIWNNWDAIYDVPPEPIARPTLIRFISFDLLQYPPFIAASAFWLFHRELFTAWGRRTKVKI